MVGVLDLESFEIPDSLRTSLPLEAKNARFNILTAAMLKIRNCGMLFRNMQNQPTYPITQRNISDDLRLQQDSSEDFKSPKGKSLLNKYKGSNDLVRKHVELKILLKTISFSLGQIFNTSNTDVIKFAFECYPEPMLSQHFNCANLMSHFLFDYTWLLYKSSLPTHPPYPWRFDLIPSHGFP